MCGVSCVYALLISIEDNWQTIIKIYIQWNSSVDYYSGIVIVVSLFLLRYGGDNHFPNPGALPADIWSRC